MFLRSFGKATKDSFPAVLAELFSLAVGIEETVRKIHNTSFILAMIQPECMAQLVNGFLGSSLIKEVLLIRQSIKPLPESGKTDEGHLTVQRSFAKDKVEARGIQVQISYPQDLLFFFPILSFKLLQDKISTVLIPLLIIGIFRS